MRDTHYWLDHPGDNITADERCLLVSAASLAYAEFSLKTVIVNIGVSWGASVHCLYAGAPLARLVAVDINLGFRERDQKRDLLPGVEWVQADSNQYGLEFEGPVHLLFVDGCHKYEAISRDIAAWGPHIPVGGVCLFHDYKPRWEHLKDRPELADVQQAVNEWLEGRSDLELAQAVDSIAVVKRV